MKKTILTIGSISAIAAPIAVVVSCGDDKGKTNPTNSTTNTGNAGGTGTQTGGTGSTGGTGTQTGGAGTATTHEEVHYQTDAQAPTVDQLKTKYGNDIEISTMPRTIDEHFGEAKYANWNLTKTEGRNKMEVASRRKGGQVFSNHFHPRDVANWSFENEVDGEFLKAYEPLVSPNIVGDNPIGTKSKKELELYATFNENTSRSTAGTTDLNDYEQHVLDHWSELTRVVSWAGSAGEGTIVPPKGQDTDIAHRNGVQMLGVVFMPPDQFGGSSDMYKELTVQDASGNFIVADKLVEMAQTLGFDGWFLNLETQSVAGVGKPKVISFLKYFYAKQKAAGLFTELYDFGLGGQIIMSEKDTATGIIGSIADKVACDFSTTGNYDLQEDQYGRGFDFQAKGFTEGADVAAEFNNANATENAWVYRYFKRIQLDDTEKINKFWSTENANQDPRVKAGAGKWKSMAELFDEHSVINERKAFGTSFENGHGKTYNVKGTNVLNGRFTNGFMDNAMQDILPTWTYISDLRGSDETLIDDIANTGNWKNSWRINIQESATAYSGANVLNFKGSIPANNEISTRLYASNVALKTGDKFEMITKGDVAPQVAVWTKDGANEVLTKITGTTTTEGIYKKTAFTVPAALNGKQMISFGTIFEGKAAATTIDTDVSTLNFTPVDAAAAEAFKIQNVKNGGEFDFLNKHNMRLSWDVKDNKQANAHHYLVWEVDADMTTKKQLLGMTSRPAIYLQDVKKRTNTRLVIEAYDDTNTLLTSQKTLVRSMFVPSMNDDTKWAVNLDETNADGSPIVDLKQGGTTSFTDSKGDIYVGTDGNKVLKISKGKLISKETTGDDLGWDTNVIPVMGPTRQFIQRIFEVDATTLGVFSSNGMFMLIDKESGKRARSNGDAIAAGLDPQMFARAIPQLLTQRPSAGALNPMAASYTLDNISRMQDGSLLMAVNLKAQGINTSTFMFKVAPNWAIDPSFTGGYEQGIQMQEGMMNRIKITGSIGQGPATFLIAATQTGNAFIPLQPLMVGNIQTIPMLPGPTLAGMSQAIGAQLGAQHANPALAQTFLMGKIVWTKEVGANILAINEYGVLFKMGMSQSGPAVSGVTLLIDAGAIGTAATAVNPGLAQSWPMMLKRDGGLVDSIVFDEHANTLTFDAPLSAAMGTDGQPVASDGVFIADITKFIAAGTPAEIKVATTLQTDANHLSDIGAIAVQGSRVLAFDSDGKMEILDATTLALRNQVKVTFAYDGKDQESLETIYKVDGITVPDRLKTD